MSVVSRRSLGLRVIIFFGFCGVSGLGCCLASRYQGSTVPTHIRLDIVGVVSGVVSTLVARRRGLAGDSSHPRGWLPRGCGYRRVAPCGSPRGPPGRVVREVPRRLCGEAGADPGERLLRVPRRSQRGSSWSSSLLSLSPSPSSSPPRGWGPRWGWPWPPADSGSCPSAWASWRPRPSSRSDRPIAISS